MAWSERLRRVAPGVLWAPGFLLAWEAIVRGLEVPLYIVPPPSAVLWQH